MERTLYAKLVATLDESLTLPIPQRFLREAWLPGAQAAWHQGLCTERESLLALVLTPMPGHGVERLIGAAVELALLDSKHFSERFDSGALGGRLADLARAEVASRVAACLAAALNVVDIDAFEGDSGVVSVAILDVAGHDRDVPPLARPSAEQDRVQTAPAVGGEVQHLLPGRGASSCLCASSDPRLRWRRAPHFGTDEPAELGQSNEFAMLERARESGSAGGGDGLEESDGGRSQEAASSHARTDVKHVLGLTAQAWSTN